MLSPLPIPHLKLKMLYDVEYEVPSLITFLYIALNQPNIVANLFAIFLNILEHIC